ncbi:MAG TPA: type II secretion system protein GspM [Caulobacteraceae bacterium]
MRPLLPRERRLVAVGMLIAAVAVAWLAIVGPVVGGFYDRAAERRQLQATVQRNQRLMAALPAWRAVALAQRASTARFAISAPSEQIATETLKERLQHIAADEGFSVTAIEGLPADASAGTVKIRADMELSLPQLCESLRRVETEGAYVIVDYLSISADRALATGRLSPMAARLELSAAYRPARPRAS